MDILDKVEDIAATVHKIDKDLAVHKSAFIEHIKQDEQMLIELRRLNDILQVNTDSLKEHMYRTELAEQQLATVQKILAVMDDRLKSVEKEQLEAAVIAKYRQSLMIKIGKILSLIGAVIMGIMGLLRFISS